MANDQINQYPITAVTIEDESFFDIDQWTGAAFESQKVPATLMASVFGVNIGNSDLQCTDPIRKLLLQGTDPDGVRFSVRNSADTLDFFRVAGGGVITFNEAFSFPLVDGGVGEVLTTDGAGNVSWAAAGGGGTNIGNSDLTISATGVRELQMFDALVTSQFNLRNSADTQNIFSFGGEGTMAIGLNANNSGANSQLNVVIGGGATNGGSSYTTVVGYQATASSLFATAIGYNAKSNWQSVALGYLANANTGQYNVAIGASAATSQYYNIAIGRSSNAYDKAIAIGGNATNASALLSIALGYNAISSAASSVMINTSGVAQTNAQTQSLAVNLGGANHVFNIAETTDQWNIGTGSFGYGTMTPDASAVVQMDSTTKGFLPPVMRTAEKGSIASPATGLMVFDTDLGKLCVYTGAAWETVTSV